MFSSAILACRMAMGRTRAKAKAIQPKIRAIALTARDFRKSAA
jgi:hypothetical protein